MIIICPCGKKKFVIEDNLIPENGRLLQCGSCDEKWFFNKSNNIEKNVAKTEFTENKSSLVNVVNDQVEIDKDDTPKTTNHKKDYELTKYNPKSNYSFSKFLSHILVVLISFIGLIIIIDTFKKPLYEIFPYLELVLFSFFETIKDINLFIKDLI